MHWGNAEGLSFKKCLLPGLSPELRLLRWMRGLDGSGPAQNPNAVGPLKVLIKKTYIIIRIIPLYFYIHSTGIYIYIYTLHILYIRIIQKMACSVVVTFYVGWVGSTDRRRIGAARQVEKSLEAPMGNLPRKSRFEKSEDFFDGLKMFGVWSMFFFIIIFKFVSSPVLFVCKKWKMIR